MTQTFPPDEFDLVNGPGGRRGAHRARPGVLAGLVPVVLVVLLVAAVAAGVNTLVGSGAPESAVTDALGEPPADPGTLPAADSGTQSPPVEPAPTTTEPAPEPTTAEPSTPPPTVDRGAAVTVLNGTGTAGLAAGAAAELEDAGWTVARTDNFRSRTVPTTVFYASAELLATAEAVAEDLGGAQVELDPDVADEITVVLGDDFPGA